MGVTGSPGGHACCCVGTILNACPRELLLLLKTNDCLRTITGRLGNPSNTYWIMAQHCVSAINHDRFIRDTSTWKLATRLSNLQDTAEVTTAFWVFTALEKVMAWF